MPCQFETFAALAWKCTSDDKDENGPPGKPPKDSKPPRDGKPNPPKDGGLPPPCDDNDLPYFPHLELTDFPMGTDWDRYIDDGGLLGGDGADETAWENENGEALYVLGLKKKNVLRRARHSILRWSEPHENRT